MRYNVLMIGTPGTGERVYRAEFDDDAPALPGPELGERALVVTPRCHNTSAFGAHIAGIFSSVSVTGANNRRFGIVKR